ncbi:hypothetical protein D1007_42807 [Hordeum vulgare]|nr:hypothetical protein D1007_42807 [Hordeum vulgare]
MASASTTHPGSSSGNRRGKAPIDLESEMKNMKLKESELDAVMVGEEEIAQFTQENRWLAVAKVNTTKTFNAESFKTTMKFILRLAQEPSIREADDNLFIVQVFYVGDWNRVMHQGPWIFRGLMVVLEEYDGKGKPHAVALERTYVWAQIHDTPELHRREGVLDQLARRIGQVKSVELNPARVFEGNYVRVQAKIKVGEPLVRFTPLKISGEEIMLLSVKYEKIGFFCEVCGIMGHSLEECGDGVHDPDEIEYGNWMIEKRRAIPSYQYSQASHSNPPRNRGRGRRSAGDARETHTARKRSSHEADLSDNEILEDTTESPMKTTPDGQSDGEEIQEGVETQALMVVPTAKKKLDMSAISYVNNGAGMVVATSEKELHDQQLVEHMLLSSLLHALGY